jgi:hypothetical protein
MPSSSEDIGSFEQGSTVETTSFSNQTSVELACVFKIMVAGQNACRRPTPLYIVQEQAGDLKSKVFGIRMYASCTEKSGPLLDITIHHDSQAPEVFSTMPSPMSNMPDQSFHIALRLTTFILQAETLAKTLDCVSARYQTHLSKWKLKPADRNVLDYALDRIGNGNFVLDTEGAQPRTEKPWTDFKASCEKWDKCGKWEKHKRLALKRKRNGDKKTRKPRFQESD